MIRIKFGKCQHRAKKERVDWWVNLNLITNKTKNHSCCMHKTMQSNSKLKKISSKYKIENGRVFRAQHFKNNRYFWIFPLLQPGEINIISSVHKMLEMWRRERGVMWCRSQSSIRELKGLVVEQLIWIKMKSLHVQVQNQIKKSELRVEGDFRTQKIPEGE